MRILVTGGAGFLGSHTCEALADRGHDVVLVDDLSAGTLGNLESVSGRCDLTVGSVLDQDLVAGLVGRAERVVHLASLVGVDRVAADPRGTARVIVDGTRVVLAAARRHGVPTICVSSSEVYGFASRATLREEAVATALSGDAPRLAYSRAKLAADRRCRRLRAAGAPFLVVRPFNLVGPRQLADGGAVLPRLVGAALSRRPLEVHGHGTQRRTFLHVRDAAELLADLVAAERWPFDAVNLGGVEECSILEMARRVRAVLSATAPIHRVPPPQSRGGVEIARRVPDLTRLRALTGRPCRLALDDAIRQLAALEPARVHARGPAAPARS